MLTEYTLGNVRNLIINHTREAFELGFKNHYQILEKLNQKLYTAIIETLKIKIEESKNAH